jgi:photosystem II stability/assembly factor-like uncharacterized protein
VLIAVAALSVLFSSTSPAASSTVTVTADVMSQISITNSCTQAPAWNLGTVIPGSPALTATDTTNICRFGFQSNNDTAMLKVGQRDGIGTAMGQQFAGWTDEAAAFVEPFQSVAFNPATPDTAVAGRSDNTVWNTVNGGTLWTQSCAVNCYPAADGQPPMDMAWETGANTVWGVGYACQVLRNTTSGSGAWSVPPNYPPCTPGNYAHTLESVDSVGGGDVYIVGYGGRVFRTLDGAATAWTNLTGTGGLPAGVDLLAVDMFSTTVVYIAASNGNVYKSVNANVATPTWTAADTGVGYLVGVAAAPNGTDVYAASTLGIARSTTGGGAGSWSAVNWYNQTGWQWNIDLWVTSNTSIYAVGDMGRLFHSTNGTTWNRLLVPTTNTISSIQVAPSGRGYAAAHGSLILGTSDGTTWGLQQADRKQSLQGVSAVSHTAIYGAGGNGTIRKSIDGGANWAAQASNTTANLWSVAAGSSTKAWAVGDGGVIRTTSDGGATAWTGLTSGTSEHLYAVSAPDSTNVWISGANGTILRSANGGTTWTTVSDAASNWYSIAAINDQVAWVGGNGLVKKTVNGGQTWIAQTLPGIGSPVRGLAAGDDKRVYASHWMWDTKIWYTDDGGATAWKQSTGLPYAVYQAIGARGSTAVMAGQWEGLRTSDGGATWTNIGGTGSASSISLIDATRAVAVTDAAAATYTSPPISITDYGANTWASPTTANLFGACLQDIGGTTAPGAWTVDGTGTCTANIGDPWYDVQVVSEEIASTALGQPGQVDLVWGFRPSDSQTKGTYSATILIEALAPDA